MLQLKNATPFATEIAIFPNDQGIDTLYTMVKASFILADSLVLADEQLPPQIEDEYYGEPGQSSIRVASDFHTGKPATDIIMLGEACALNTQPVQQLDVQLTVGQVNKRVRVIGDRHWHNGSISQPKPFTTMPILYEKAFGGLHQIDQENYLAEEQNPVGCGFVGKRSKQEMNEQPLPNIEDPGQLLQSLGDKQQPAGFGFCSPDWLPRRQYAGTYDSVWQQKRAPYLPADFDKRFLNAAHPDLIYPGYLQGGEPISIKNMHPEGEIKASVPEVKLLCKVKLGEQSHTPPMNLETLILEPNKKQLSMVWKAEFACDKKTLNIDEIEIKLSR
ncbi:DUF2169 family type VI secretion system accessory protein [Aliikangiella sp. IMCC44359]|uniref:DUF2169 family type VI secretion system accessory protein n=1 Tax=Aliikangiella sp. IMCC44359 TaxID=3459125 RepID=UPI00403A9554